MKRRVSVIAFIGSCAIATPAAGGNLVIPHQFSNGTVADADEVNRNFEEVAAEVSDNAAAIAANRSALECLLGIGTVITSLLDVDQFQAVHGTDWVLADGASALPSDYANLTQRAFLPDLRGQFLRGTGGNAAPLGEPQAAATAQPSGFSISSAGSHTHTFTGVRDAPATGVGGNGGAWVSGFGQRSTNPAGDHSHPTSGWDSETRPANVSVNFFIRINGCQAQPVVVN